MNNDKFAHMIRTVIEPAISECGEKLVQAGTLKNADIAAPAYIYAGHDFTAKTALQAAVFASPTSLEDDCTLLEAAHAFIDMIAEQAHHKLEHLASDPDPESPLKAAEQARALLKSGEETSDVRH